MSSYLVIPLITSALRTLVRSALDVLPGATVRLGPPRAAPPGGYEVNIHLYRLSPNAQLRNDLPTRSADGALVGRPGAALDLHYVISFAGGEQLAVQAMLARVVGALQATPVITGDELAKLRTSGALPEGIGDDPSAAFASVVLVPEFSSLDEMSRLWPVFSQHAHAPLLQYLVPGVLIDGDGEPSRAAAVRSVSAAVID